MSARGRPRGRRLFPGRIVQTDGDPRDRLALYWPIPGHTFLLLSLYVLGGHWQERMFLSWQVAQLVCACACVVSLWFNHEEYGIVFSGW